MHNLAQNKILKNLVFMILATTDVKSAEEIYSIWETHKVLRDYKRPGKSIIEIWVKEFVAPKGNLYGKKV